MYCPADVSHLRAPHGMCNELQANHIVFLNIAVRFKIMLASHFAGRWEARIGIPGSKHIYLGLHNSEDSAAKAYDSALVCLFGSLP